MNQRALLIKHGEDPNDDRVVTFFRAHNIDVDVRYPYKGDALPEADGSILGSVVYGGPFNVFETDKNPFLKEEHRWIEDCIKAEIPLLGLCQGAQSIAYTLGAEAGPLESGVHEFGYYEIIPTEEGKADILPQTLLMTQSHFHGFGIPEGGVRLAESALFPNQAMRYGRTTYAFQFHPEQTREGFRRWQEGSDRDQYGKPGAQTREEQDRLGELHDPAQHKWFMGFLEKLYGPAIAAMDQKKKAAE